LADRANLTKKEQKALPKSNAFGCHWLFFFIHPRQTFCQSFPIFATIRLDQSSQIAMCGIIAGVSQQSDIKNTILVTLKKLEYRGYDSSGLALINQNKLVIKHNTESIDALTELAKNMPSSTIAIAHTRWATHGKVSEANAHPHVAGCRVALVHNGIIENHAELRASLPPQTHWRSETDSEVIAQLIQNQLNQGQNIQKAIMHTTQSLKGTYALAIIDTETPNTLYCITHESSLILGKNENATFVCSDQNALLDLCQEVCKLPQDTLFTITGENISTQEIPNLQWRKLEQHLPHQLHATSTDSETSTHREIHQQPAVCLGLIKAHISENNTIENLPLGLCKTLATCKRLVMIACGSSYYAAHCGKYWIEKIAGIPVSIEIASEYRYRTPVIEPGTLLVTLSQSGETLDTISALRYFQKNAEAPLSLSIGNNALSTLAQESDFFWATQAGPEVGVATTKVFTAQLFCLLSLAAEMSPLKETSKSILQTMRELPHWIQHVLSFEKNIQETAHNYAQCQQMVFCARGPLYPIAEEAALKLKELGYVHTGAYPAGELKHGPLALIAPDLTTLFLLDKNDSYFEKIKSNICEVLARNGKVLLLGSQNAITDAAQNNPNVTTQIIFTQDPPSILMPFLQTIGAQLLTYHIAKAKGCNIDKPRNLAKCVTVE
jgi:glucosamine--fructose-6-phosphate aminotransferase (isomerizing)